MGNASRDAVTLTYGELTMETLAEAIPDPSVVYSVDLSGSNISPELCISITDTYIAAMSRLESLDLKDNSIGPRGAIHLFGVLASRCPNLHYLDLNENAIQDEALYALATLLQRGRLRTLNVVTNHITPRGLPTLCDGLSASRSLKELSLAFNLLGDDGAAIVAGCLGRHPTLTTLDLSDNRITDAGAVIIATEFILSDTSKLQTLNLSVNMIGDIGFTAISEALTKAQNRHLLHLDLGCNNIVGDAGRAALVEKAVNFRYVYSIDLTSCNLSDEDAQGLSHAIKQSSSSLTSIEWYNNPRIQWATEQALTEAIQTKEAKLSISYANAHLSQGMIVALFASGAAAVALVTFLYRRR